MNREDDDNNTAEFRSDSFSSLPSFSITVYLDNEALDGIMEEEGASPG